MVFRPCPDKLPSEKMNITPDTPTSQSGSNGTVDLQKVRETVEKIQHDVNNPLCIITMSLSRIESLIDAHPHPELVKSYEEINTSVDRIMEILSLLEDVKRKLGG